MTAAAPAEKAKPAKQQKQTKTSKFMFNLKYLFI